MTAAGKEMFCSLARCREIVVETQRSHFFMLLELCQIKFLLCALKKRFGTSGGDALALFISVGTFRSIHTAAVCLRILFHVGLAGYLYL